jgi:hypothetical protein
MKPFAISNTRMSTPGFSAPDVATFLTGFPQALHGEEFMTAKQCEKAAGILLVINMHYTGHRSQYLAVSVNS